MSNDEEEMSALALGSPKEGVAQAEPEPIEPVAGAKDAVNETGGKATSQEDITSD